MVLNVQTSTTGGYNVTGDFALGKTETVYWDLECWNTSPTWVSWGPTGVSWTTCAFILQTFLTSTSKFRGSDSTVPPVAIGKNFSKLEN